jgi:hypothetical protein
MLGFAWLTFTAEDLHVWFQFPEATFARNKLPGAKSNNQYQLGSVDSKIAKPVRLVRID